MIGRKKIHQFLVQSHTLLANPVEVSREIEVSEHYSQFEKGNELWLFSANRKMALKQESDKERFFECHLFRPTHAKAFVFTWTFSPWELFEVE